MKYLGDFKNDAIVPLGAFTTNAADGGRESFSASLEEADVTIYSDDGDGTWTAMTLDASTIIITENPGSQVGVYLIAVNMGNDADFTTRKDYVAVLYPNDETVDSQNVAAVLGHWSCENRPVATPPAFRGFWDASAGNPDATKIVQAEDYLMAVTAGTWDTNSIGIGDIIIAKNASPSASDSTDWHIVAGQEFPANFADLSVTASTGRVDVASIEGVDATNQINASCDTAISDASLATAAALTTVDTVVDGIKAVTDNLPDSGALTTLLNNVAAVLADTGELQTDWANGGRLDLLIDAIKAKTDNAVEVGTSYTYTNDTTAETEDVTITTNP